MPANQKSRQPIKPRQPIKSHVSLSKVISANQKSYQPVKNHVSQIKLQSKQKRLCEVIIHMLEQKLYQV